jgi:hypothetical protein
MDNIVICKITLSLGVLSPPFPPLSVVSAKLRNFIKSQYAQGSKLIVVIVQVVAVRIYVAAVEVLMKKERQNETQFTTKIARKTRYSGSQLFHFVKFSFPDTRLMMSYYAKTDGHLTP